MFDMFNFNTPPNSLIDSNVNPRLKITKEKGIGVYSFACNTSKVEKCVEALRCGLR
jgi:hypothetical protein